MSNRRKRNRSEHPRLRERAIDAVDRLLSEELYLPNAKEIRPFKTAYIKDAGVKYRFIDPQWHIDHVYVDEAGCVTQHPYNVTMEKLKDVISWCDANNYSFSIDGCSAYFPAHSINIRFYPKREAPR